MGKKVHLDLKSIFWILSSMQFMFLVTSLGSPPLSFIPSPGREHIYEAWVLYVGREQLDLIEVVYNLLNILEVQRRSILAAVAGSLLINL